MRKIKLSKKYCKTDYVNAVLLVKKHFFAGLLIVLTAVVNVGCNKQDEVSPALTSPKQDSALTKADIEKMCQKYGAQISFTPPNEESKKIKLQAVSEKDVESLFKSIGEQQKEAKRAFEKAQAKFDTEISETKKVDYYNPMGTGFYQNTTEYFHGTSSISYPLYVPIFNYVQSTLFATIQSTYDPKACRISSAPLTSVEMIGFNPSVSYRNTGSGITNIQGQYVAWNMPGLVTIGMSIQLEGVTFGFYYSWPTFAGGAIKACNC